MSSYLAKGAQTQWHWHIHPSTLPTARLKPHGQDHTWKSSNSLVLLHRLFSCSSLPQLTLTPPKTSPPNPNVKHSQVMAGHVVQMHLCGHFECSPMPGGAGSQYVFIDGACSRHLCTQTDAAWFQQQGESPSALDMSLLEKYSQQLTAFQKAANKYVDRLADVSALNLQAAAEAGFPVLQQITAAEDPTDYTDSLFHLSTIKSLLKYARDFAKNCKTRPFFDFCMCELTFFVADATAAENNLLNALAMSAGLSTDLLNFSGFRQWPGSRAYHEPNFGKKQLDTLHSVGSAAEEDLQRPFSMDMMQQCELVVRNAGHHSTPTPPQLTLPSLPIIPSVSVPEPPLGKDADFGVWLSQQENAFVAQLKRNAAKNEKKAVRQGRITKLRSVRTAMDSKW